MPPLSETLREIDEESAQEFELDIRVSTVKDLPTFVAATTDVGCTCTCDTVCGTCATHCGTCGTCTCGSCYTGGGHCCQ